LQQTVEANRTLLVDGPASAKLVSGKAEIFGYPIKTSQRIVVREGKRLPFFAQENSVFDVSLGPNASMSETVGSTIPTSWRKPVEAALALQKRPGVVLVLGMTDCGKSSFCTHLLNSLIDGKSKVAVLDGDIGQSDIGPSGTIAYALASKRIPELYDLKLKNAYFVGATSPIKAMAKVLEGLTAMKAELLQQIPDFVLINTDGWVSDDIAVRYKTSLIDALKPDVLVGVQMKDELAPLIANLQTLVITVEPSSALSQRPAEKRKILREMTYSRYLKKSKLQCYPKSQVTIEPKNTLPNILDPEKGVLVGLYGRGTKFLGIGVLREINPVRKVLKVQTAVSAKPLRIIMGKVVVNTKLQEV
jgi:polynucleotide 5'-hydroxyl-kinase GRC3/NOL9